MRISRIIALRQINNRMKEKLKSLEKWDAINSSRCPVDLLKLLQDICYQGSKTKVHTPTNIIRCMRKLMCTRRFCDATTYVLSTTQVLEALDAIGGSVLSPALIKYELETNTAHKDITYSEFVSMDKDNTVQTAIEKGAKQQFLATILIEGSNDETSTLKETLENQFSLGTNN